MINVDANKKEAVSHDQINMTKIELEYDSKMYVTPLSFSPIRFKHKYNPYNWVILILKSYIILPN